MDGPDQNRADVAVNFARHKYFYHLPLPALRVCLFPFFFFLSFFCSLSENEWERNENADGNAKANASASFLSKLS